MCTGEIFGVIGPNGAGKSTLFNAIAGVVLPSSGTVTFNGSRVERFKPHRRNWLGIGRTFQSAQSFPSQRVFECLLNARIARHRGLRGWFRPQRPVDDAEIIRDLLGFSGLKDVQDRLPSELTNLQQQKLAIAMALATDCMILLLDEPSGGLIESEVLELQVFIRNIRDMGTTIVVIDHKMRLMMELCDRIMVMATGKQIAVGTPAEIAAHEEVLDVYLGRPAWVEESGA